MRAWLRRFLDLRPGEAQAVGYTFLYVAIAVASFLLAKPIRNGLFLAEFGPYRLVYVYVTVPVVLSLFVPLYQGMAARVGQRHVITLSLIFFCLNVIGFWWGFRYHPAPWLSAAFYVWVNCYGVIAPVQAWTFANDVFDTRQARRLFGLIGSGASFGAIVGGLLAQFLVRPVGGTVNLLLVLAALILLAAVVVNAGWKVRRRDATPRAVRGPRVPLASTLGLIARTRYLRLLAAVVFIVAVVTQWTQFQFNVAAAARFANDTDALTRFFGMFNFWMGVAAFLVQILVTGPLLRQFGIAVTILVLPLALGVGSSLILAFPLLWAVLLTNALDQGLRFSVDKATFELLYLPIPSAIKTNVKATIDLIINRVADGVGGVLLGIATQGFNFYLFSVAGFGLGLRGIAAWSLAGIAIWIVVAHRLRHGYVEAIRESIHQHRLDIEGAPALLDRSTSDLLATRLSAPDPNDILYALELFSSQHQQAVHPAVRSLLTHASARVRRRALTLLDEAGDVVATSQVESLLRDPDLETRTLALLFLAHHAQVDPLRTIQEVGDFPDYSVQAGMVAFLSQPGPLQNIEASAFFLETMIDDTDGDTTRSRVEAARLIARLPVVYDQALARLLADPLPEVVREAIVAVGVLRAEAFVPQLIDALGRGACAADAADAIAQMGEPAVSALCRALASAATPVAARCDVLGVLARIGGDTAQQAMAATLIDGDISVRQQAMVGLARLVQLHPEVSLDRAAVEAALAHEVVGHYRTYRIIGTLDHAFAGDDPAVAGVKYSMSQELERIFTLLGLLWPKDDLPSVLVGLRADSALLRANAIELLDNVLTADLRKLIVPLVDPTVTIAERIDRAASVVGATLETREAAVAALVASDDPWLKSCGVYAVGALRLTALRDQIVQLASTPDPLLRETVRAARARLDTDEAVPAARPAPATPTSSIFTVAPDLGVG